MECHFPGCGQASHFCTSGSQCDGNISIDINPAANVQAGTYKIPVRATTSSTSADIELEVVVTGSYDIELTTPRGLLSAEITAGDMKRIDLLVRNNGSAELKDVQLTASKPVDWEVTFEPSKIEKLTAGGRRMLLRR